MPYSTQAHQRIVPSLFHPASTDRNNRTRLPKSNSETDLSYIGHFGEWCQAENKASEYTPSITTYVQTNPNDVIFSPGSDSQVAESDSSCLGKRKAAAGGCLRDTE